MMEITTPPVVTFSCLNCGRPLTLVGGDPVRCCGQEYRLELAIHTRVATEADAYRAALAEQIARGERGKAVTIPPAPPTTAQPVPWEMP